MSQLANPTAFNSVSGTIYDSFNAPLAAANVQVFDKDLRTEQMLGSATSDTGGRYLVRYAPNLAAASEYRSVDIFIRVLGKDGGILGQSSVSFNAAQDFVLDFKIGNSAIKPPSEFDRITGLVRPLAESQKVALADLQENQQFADISFLAGETGEDAALLGLIPVAFTFSGKTRIAADIFYGLFRLQYPKTLDALIRISNESIVEGILTATNENIISPQWGVADRYLAVVAAFNKLGTDQVMASADKTSAGVKQVIGAALPDASQQQVFLNTYFASENDTSSFWTRLGQQPGFDPATVSGVQLSLQFNLLTGTPALANLLFAERKQNPALTDASGLATLSQADWKSRIDKLMAAGTMGDFPVGTAGNTPAEKAASLATAITANIASAFPTRVFSSSLEKDKSDAFSATRKDLITFLANNPDYELSGNHAEAFFDKSGLDGISDKKALKKEMATINRLTKITGDYSAVAAMRALGIDSATKLILTFSQKEFTARMASVADPATAFALYKTAEKIDKRATVLALGFKTKSDIPVYAIDGSGALAASTYEAMFGAGNCDCEECQSVYSPAAYFVDILNQIRKHNPAAFDIITTRRPDLVQILLTCRNTNTALPYIDLVNELLENALNPLPPVMVDGVPVYAQYQTTNSVEELVAYPEHDNLPATDRLKNARSGFNLPLDAALEQTRLCLAKLGSARAEIMRLFLPEPAASSYSHIAVESEFLGLSPVELSLVNGTTPTPVPIGKVTEFLAATGLSYVEMLGLLQCEFVNPIQNAGRLIGIVSTTADPASCRIEDLTLQSNQATSLTILPFIRLWKKLGCTFYELDTCFTAFGITSLTGDVDGRLIVPLSDTIRLSDALNLPIGDVTIFWSAISTAIYADPNAEGQPLLPSRYESLFQNKQLTNPLDPDFADPALFPVGIRLRDKTATIQAALNLSQTDFDALDQARFQDGALSLANLSVLFRYAALARSLKISVQDLIGFMDLSGNAAFSTADSAADTIDFIDLFNLVRNSGFSVSAALALLQQSPPGSTTNDTSLVSDTLDTIRQGLKKIDALLAPGVTAAEQAENKLKNQSNLIEETLAAAFRSDARIIDLLINGLIKSAADATKAAITIFLDPAFIASDGVLFTTGSNQQIVWTFPHQVATFRALAMAAGRLTKFQSTLTVTADDLVTLVNDAGLLGLDGLWTPPATTTPILFAAFRRLLEWIRFRDDLGLTGPAWPDIPALAQSTAADAKGAMLKRIVQLTHATDSDVTILLGDPLNAADKGLLQLQFPGDYLDGRLLSRVLACLRTVAVLGSDVGSIGKLTAVAPDAGIAKGLLKARYDAPTWLDIIKPISNRMRLRTRDALISFLLTSPDADMTALRSAQGLASVKDLYDHFLIDPEMDACMLTSRIKQAISSLQLFVDRAILNLEPGVAFDAAFTSGWNIWRKRYRVWEANRKIFLYPENWIEPELRDDKSPFFMDLEKAMLQTDVTFDTAEYALLDYLGKLDTVANLEMAGLFRETDTGTVHAIGRTRNTPNQYFYSRQVAGVWTAWEKIGLDVEGDHVLPVLWNNRLMLFWAKFLEKESRDTASAFAVPAAHESISPAPKRVEVTLVWSEYKNGKWLPKQLSSDPLIVPEMRVTDHRTSPAAVYYTGGDPGLFSIGSFINGDQLMIRVFGPWNYTYGSTQNNRFGAFVFDGCHSGPSVKAADAVTPGLQVFSVAAPNAGVDNKMFVDEGTSDAFSVFDSGVLKPFLNSAPASGTVLLKNTPGKFRLMPARHQLETQGSPEFFFRNDRNNFFVHASGGIVWPPLSDISVLAGGLALNRQSVTPVSTVKQPVEKANGFDPLTVNLPATGAVADLPANPVNLPISIFRRRYNFQTFYHAHVCELIKTLNRDGVQGFYTNLIVDIDGTILDGIQNRKPAPVFLPGGAYDPTPSVSLPYPVEQVDFTYGALYSLYNWELFFHIPLLIATRLSQNQQFEDARKWFHYIFDPTRSSADTTAARFWLTKPFKQEIANGILSIDQILAAGGPELDAQLANWETHPFNPHAVARLRLSAYMRSTLMKYLDNLIAWGDQLFRQDTLETINEATLLYMQARNLLGPRPEMVPPRATPREVSFATIGNDLDAFSNAKVYIESFFSPSTLPGDDDTGTATMPLFCIPKNDELLAYWDLVEDRLYKIRHCLNIDGVFQQLPLFEPPIDPALLVASGPGAGAGGLLNEMMMPTPVRRFRVQLQHAVEICGDVRSLGAQLLAALEKQDAESLALFRSMNEKNLLQAVRDVKQLQVDEASAAIEILQATKAGTQATRDYYAGRQKINAQEQVQLSDMSGAIQLLTMASGIEKVSSILAGIPQSTAGVFSFGITFGGHQLADISAFMASMMTKDANVMSTGASQAGLNASLNRRQDDWTYQVTNADLSLKQIDKQIAAAQVRLAAASKDLNNQDLQIEQSSGVYDFLSGKFTSQDLYGYMTGEITALYFQAYQLAYGVAKKAERCFQYELGLPDSDFIRFGYWDSLRKGLLSGEKLLFDLRRLEDAFLDKQVREFELSKNISMAALQPSVLIQLRETGACDVDIAEAIFDLDFPGHYFRRLKSVTFSAPCLTGSNTVVNIVFRLVSNEYRVDNTATTGADYAKTAAEISTPGSGRFRSVANPVSAIATSHGQNDGGVFELNFRDDQYLPFEGAGASGKWRIEMMSDAALRQFDYESISDIIVHLKYTARDGGAGLKQASMENLRNLIAAGTGGGIPLALGIDVAHDFADQWHLFANGAGTGGNTTLILAIGKNRFPFFTADKPVKVQSLMLFAGTKDKNDRTSIPFNQTGSLTYEDGYALFRGSVDGGGARITDASAFAFTMTMAMADVQKLDRLFLVVAYVLS